MEDRERLRQIKNLVAGINGVPREDRPEGVNGIVSGVGQKTEYRSADIVVSVGRGVMHIHANMVWLPYVSIGREIVVSDSKEKPHILWIQT